MSGQVDRKNDWVIGSEDQVEPNHLVVGSSYDLEEEEARIAWMFQGKRGMISVLEARQRAAGLRHAAIVGEVEASMINGFVAVQAAGKERGLGFAKRSEKDDAEQWIGFMTLVRSLRAETIPGVEVIYGQESKEARYNIPEEWYGVRTQMDFDEVLHHAETLSAAAEAAETDAFLIHFFRNNLGAPDDVLLPLLMEFRQFRYEMEMKMRERDAEEGAESGEGPGEGSVPIGVDGDGNPIVMNMDEGPLPFGQPKSGVRGDGDAESN